MRKVILLIVFAAMAATAFALGNIVTTLALKTAGNEAVSCVLQGGDIGVLTAAEPLSVKVERAITRCGGMEQVRLTITAQEDVYFSISQEIAIDMKHSRCDFYMPGFWYRKNSRSPSSAPSFAVSDGWEVRDDRLSTPLVGAYDVQSKRFCTVMHTNISGDDCIPQHLSGDVCLPGATAVGSVGFRNVHGDTRLVVTYPYTEAPKRYIRKLTLIDPIRSFAPIAKGESIEVTWEIRTGKAEDFGEFVADVWRYAFDSQKPQPVATGLNASEAKKVLSNYFVESFVDDYELKFFSCLQLPVNTCSNRAMFELGFIGKVLYNAYNALEYGENTHRSDLMERGNKIFDSFLTHGFTPGGFLREEVNFEDNEETRVYSIRRQSEASMALLYYLQYERSRGRLHTEWEAKVTSLLQKIVHLQQDDGSFARKFDDEMNVIDHLGGSTPLAILPLAMAHRYFGDKCYADAAVKAAKYLETELIGKSDYFSTTLDANCEDKEAAIYSAIAMYYLTLVSSGAEREHYIALMRKAAYFALSWFYTWDVPFAPSQMLGDVGFKTRGWGNVSVENNHVDVYVFDFVAVLRFLGNHAGEKRLAQFADVISTSMLQLMPMNRRMCGVGKEGFYPEVVQHTTWDYGDNGKGFYNDVFAPGWTVASLWTILSPERLEQFFGR